MVIEYRGAIESLRDALRAGRFVWLFCRCCGHAQRCDPRRLVERAGRDLSFVELAPRLACRRCGRKGYATILAAEQRLVGRND